MSEQIGSVSWEELSDDNPGARRLSVPGGWLYQVELPSGLGWFQPIFVPKPQIATVASPAVDTLCIVDDGVAVPKSEDFWRGFVRGLSDLVRTLGGRVRERGEAMTTGSVLEIIEELTQGPSTYLEQFKASPD